MIKRPLSIVLGAAFLWGFSANPSGGVETGKQAPPFSLTSIHGQNISLDQLKGKYVVLEWINHGCPFVRKQYDAGNMQRFQEKWTQQNVVWLSICSSAKGKEGFMGTEEWVRVSDQKKSKATDVLIDSDGKIGKAYGAKTTPHMFVIDPKGTLIYQGAFDSFKDFKDDLMQLDNYVDQALTEAMANKEVSVAQTKSYGCSVKY